jgi:hypothetical protein
MELCRQTQARRSAGNIAGPVAPTVFQDKRLGENVEKEVTVMFAKKTKTTWSNPKSANKTSI